MKFKILRVLDDQIRFLDKDGNLKIEPNTPYFRLKLLQSKGRRIRHTFARGIKVQETFDPMVFNAEYRGDVTQIRPNFADKLCESIEVHRKTRDMKLFDDIFRMNYSVTYNTEIIEGTLKQYGGRVKVTEEGFIVDDLFIVDRKGSAWMLENDERIKKGRGAGGSLCLVVGQLPPSQVAMTSNGPVELDKNTMTVLAKIWFLLNPNLNDHVFTGQLPKETLEILKRNDDDFLSNSNKVKN